jgi:hypothetical protein
MASILDKYGIKEVADVVFYELDSKGAPSAPVLYLDTLKVSTIEQSAEVTDATGGKGNVKLISWDSNKEVSATFEDALFSVKSLAIMFGGKVSERQDHKQEVLKTVPKAMVTVHTSGSTPAFDGWVVDIGQHRAFVPLDKAILYAYDAEEIKAVARTGEGSSAAYTGSEEFDYMTFDLLDAKKVNSDGTVGTNAGVATGLTINIDASTFGGTYYITGDTYARSQESGKDEYLQFIIPKAKVSSEDLSLTMEADGDPSTFTMNIRALKASDGSMFKLVKYAFGVDASSGTNLGVASVLADYDEQDVERDAYDTNAVTVDSNNLTP